MNPKQLEKDRNARILKGSFGIVPVVYQQSLLQEDLKIPIPDAYFQCVFYMYVKSSFNTKYGFGSYLGLKLHASSQKRI